ncbi:hypothetical protein G7046_g9444 [Stylonectria norvegica]|nr:hypothetical protein G7046_g9444 [Stylonectria norvegica]
MALPPSYRCTVRDHRCPAISSPYAVVQSCNHAHDKSTRSARPLFTVTATATVPSSTASMSIDTVVPPDKAIRSLLSCVSPNVAVQELEAVPSARLQLLYHVKVSEGPSLLLALPPPAAMRLLRSEQSSIAAEAAVLKWLSGLAPVLEHRTLTCSQEVRPCGSREVGMNMGMGGKMVAKGGSPGGTHQTTSNSTSLSKYLPVLVRHGSIDGSLAMEYNLSRPPRGVAVSVLSWPLTNRERQAVDFQSGQLLRQISTHVSPNRRFGSAIDILAAPPSVAQLRRHERGLQVTTAADSWSVAFHALLESTLRDAEDVAVMIGYDAIRRHFDRFRHLLDAVVNPRLVVVDAGEDMNTLVIRPNDGGRRTKPTVEVTEGRRRESRLTGKEKESRKPRGLRTPEQGSDWSDKAEIESDHSEEDYFAMMDAQAHEQIEVTGLRQWSNCIFGDPLLASVFSKHPTRHFWRGFGRADARDSDSPDSPSSIIEDEPNAHIRLLLYECYHAAIAVVKEFYRPQSDGGTRELTARKQLSSVLARLDGLDDSGSPRRRRPSGEMSPAKRPKPEND